MESAMNCPVCKNTKLVISERQGIEIDYCPDCRGVWLDRGELDKIIEKSYQSQQPSRPFEEKRSRDDDDYDDYKDEYKHGHKRKKRGGFLEDIFDF
jgi:hypothetical protein